MMTRVSFPTLAVLVACLVAGAAGSRVLSAKNVFGGGPNISKTLGVSDVRYFTGVFKITSRDGAWLQETNNGEAINWQETERDEWNIYLTKSNGETVTLNLRQKVINSYDAQSNYKNFQPIISICDSLYCWEDNCQCYPWYQVPSGYENIAPKLNSATWARGGK